MEGFLLLKMGKAIGSVGCARWNEVLLCYAICILLETRKQTIKICKELHYNEHNDTHGEKYRTTRESDV